MAKRILFITANRVGDAVLSTGILARLLADHPGALVTIVCGPPPASLFDAVPGLERVIVLDKKRYSLHWLDLWRQCIGRVWDIVVDLRNTPLSYLLLARRQFRMGRVGDGHRLERLARVMNLEGEVPAPKIWITDANRRAADALVPAGPPVLAVGPTANWRGKTWPEDRFVELVRRLTGPSGAMAGWRVAIFGHAAERASVAGFIDSVPSARRIDLVGKVSLLEAQACLERAGLYIGNDSGLMHMAAASGTPTLGLFGPTNDENYSPWGPHCAVAREGTTRDAYPESFDGFDARTTDSLMTGLSVDRVAEAAADLLAGATATASGSSRA